MLIDHRTEMTFRALALSQSDSVFFFAASFHLRQTSHGKPHLDFAASKNLFHCGWLRSLPVAKSRFARGSRGQYFQAVLYIGNADQTPHTFDIVTNTVSEKGVKSVSILTTSHKKDRFTIMLACLGDGTKLQPYVIFKWKTLPKNATFRKVLLSHATRKGGWTKDLHRTGWVA